MKKCFLLARANLQRAKGQAVGVAVLILLAAFMLNLWLMLSMDYKQNFERCHERLNSEHVTLVVDGGAGAREFLAQRLESDRRTAGYSLDDALHMVSIFAWQNGEVNSEFVYLEKEAALSRPVGPVEIVEEGECTSGIYMPVLYRSEEIAIGKTIEISIGSHRVSYMICGFFNSTMAGSHNCGLCELILTEDKYSELKEAGYAPEATLCSIRLTDREESEDYEAELKNAVSSYDPAARTVSNSYALVFQSRYISQMICAGILSAMAFLILLIALVVIASNIVNYIQEHMKNLGALKAVGYTSRQLVSSLLLQFLGIALTASIAGAGLSYGLFPSLNAMMISQTGIPYAVHFLPVPFALTLVILVGAVALAVWLSSRRIKRVEPIVALREGILTHNFRRNHVPLEETAAPLTVALALKTMFAEKKYTVTVCLTMLVLSLVIVFSGVMKENMITDMTPFIHMIVGETADSCINVNAQAEERFLREMGADGRVSQVYLYTSLEVRHVGGIGLLTTISDDFARVNNQEMVFEGRFPRYDNEIAVAGKYAAENGLQIGDEIRIMAEGKEAAYIISGFTQTSSNLGKDCLLTRDGYERLGELQNVSYYLNLMEGTDIDRFHTGIEERFGSELNATVNIAKIIEGSASIYVSLMTAIVVAVLALGGIVVAFVLYLMVRTMLNRKKREYGILKALGFTTRELILQTALSFMPAVAVSTAVGLVGCSFIINPLMALFLKGIGIVKCTFAVPIGLIAVTGAGLVGFAFAVACLLSLKIRRITPGALLMGE